MDTLYICSLGIVALVNGVEGCPPPKPPIHQIAILWTNYYPIDEDGNWQPFNYQADDSPQYTGTGFRLEKHLDGKVAACIGEWTTIGWTKAVTFNFQGNEITLVCLDEFGAPGYREPFYHPGLERWVICVDMFSSKPTYEIIYDWTLSTVNTSTLQ